MKKTARFNFTSLFRLIKSLTMSERIYFKKFASVNFPHEEGALVELFNVMEGMKAFDKHKMEADFGKNKPGIKINQAGFNLNYQLMGALRVYHSNISVGAQLKDSLRDMELLYIKGHYIQCKKLLKKAKKKASRYERLDRIIELLEWERKLVSKDIRIEHQEKFMRKIFDELGQVLEKKLNRYELELCFNVKYSRIKRYSMIRSEEDLYNWEQLTDVSEILSGRTPLTFTGEIYHHFIYSMDYYARGQMHKVLNLVQDRFEALKLRPELIKDSPHQYITVLGNILSCRASLSIIMNTSHNANKKEFLKQLDVLREFGSSSIELETRVYANITIHEIGFCINTGDFNKASALSEKATRQMETRSIRLGKNAELAFLYYSSYAHFVCEKYDQVTEALNYFLANNFGETRIDLQCYARILNVMLHYEMRDIHILERATIDAENFIVNNGRMYKIERIIMALFKKIATENLSTNATSKAFIDLDKKLSLAGREKYADNFDEYKHFMWWVESKIGGKSITELARAAIHKK